MKFEEMSKDQQKNMTKLLRNANVTPFEYNNKKNNNDYYSTLLVNLSLIVFITILIGANITLVRKHNKENNPEKRKTIKNGFYVLNSLITSILIVGFGSYFYYLHDKRIPKTTFLALATIITYILVLYYLPKLILK